jgi:CBS domain containing-hemolysin-like protein
MPSAPPPTYRQRLRLEGAVLAAAGALGSALLLAFADEASERAASTALQITFVAAVLAVAGPVFVRRWLAAAKPVAGDGAQTGQPTALWKPPLVVAVLTALFVVPGELGVGAVGWDAGLRITLGCMLVGLAQAVLLERIVASDESRHGRSYVRLPGSQATSGTNLGFFLSKHA